MKCNIEKLHVRRQRNILKIMFGQSRNNDNIKYYRPERVLRSNDKVKLKSKFTRISKIKRSPYYRGISLWNKLPQSMQCEQDKTRFKKAVNGLDMK